MYSKMALESSTRVFQRRRWRSSICMVDQNDSIMALSKASPMEPQRWHQSRPTDLVGEGPGGELDSVVGMDDRASLRRALSDGHVEGVHDELGILDRIDRPSDDASAAGVHNGAAVDLALAGAVLGDVGDPELVELEASELALHQILRVGVRFMRLTFAGPGSPAIPALCIKNATRPLLT